MVQGDLVDRRVDLAALEQRRQAEANRSRVGVSVWYSGLIPSRSRPSDQHAAVAVEQGEGEHAEEALDARGPHLWKALSSTSVSVWEKKR